MNEKELIAAREAKNAYMREYRKKNREKIKAIEQRYWAKKAAAGKKAEGDAEKEVSA